MATQSTTLFVNQGADHIFSIYVTNDDGSPKDLTGYSARAKFARSPSSVTKYTISASIRTPSTLGIVDLTLGSSTTLNIKPGLYVFDAEIYIADSNDADGIVVERILEGNIELSGSVTQ